MFLEDNGTKWFRGNLHTHTTVSDGQRTPMEAIALYQAKGYDFLALTDHWKFGQPRQEGNLLLLSGCEYDVGHSVAEGIYHIVGIGMECDSQLERTGNLGAQQLIDDIHSEGGLAILAHPAWSMDRPEVAAQLTGLDGCEIYNTTSAIPWNCRPYSGVFLDDLASRGIRLPCMAADDAHWYNGDETRSYLMVKAKELTREALLEAIRRGDFYASQGPRFSITREGDVLTVRSTPVQNIVFFTDSVWVPDRVTAGDGIQEAVYKIKSNDSFVRVELTDAEGNMAWSSFIEA